MSKTAEHQSSNLGGNGGGGVSSSPDPTVSKYSGQPGALTALRVDYSSKDRAFAPHGLGTPLGKVRSEVKHFSAGPRLGDKPAWSQSSSTAPLSGVGAGGGPLGSVHHAPPNSCIGTAVPGLPQRPLMAQNSVYQGVKLNYNFRAGALPPVKEVLYIPKHNKLEMDRTAFLVHEAMGQSGHSTAVIADKCLMTTAALSRREHQNTFEGRRQGDVHPLTDTFGDYVVRRHMAVRGAAQTSGGPPNGKGDHSFSGSGVVGNGSFGATDGSLGHKQLPYTLRDLEDVGAQRFGASGGGDSSLLSQKEAGWNTSSALDADRTNVYKLRPYKDYRPITKKKEASLLLKTGGANGGQRQGGGARGGEWPDASGGGGDPDLPVTIDIPAEMAAAKASYADAVRLRRGAYTSPIERQKQISEAQRAKKTAQREAAAATARAASIDNATLRGATHSFDGRGGNSSLLSSGVVYKMSNKDEWWSAVPPEIEKRRAELAASHVGATGAFTDVSAVGEGAVGGKPHALNQNADSSDDSDAE